VGVVEREGTWGRGETRELAVDAANVAMRDGGRGVSVDCIVAEVDDARHGGGGERERGFV